MKMLMIGVLWMFTGDVTGLLTKAPVCRFTQSVLCYGAVGHPLYLELQSEYELTLKSRTGSDVILRLKNKIIKQIHRDYPRWQFITENTTMIITSAKKIDSGNYTLELFSSDGTNKGVYYLQLIIEDVVSSVKVTDSCWPPENRSVYCSSDGDNLSFNWTLSGITHQLNDRNLTLLLNKEAVGSVTCLVENHVSRGNATIVLQQCSDFLFVCVWVLEIVILMSILGSFHIYIRLDKKPKAAEDPESKKRFSIPGPSSTTHSRPRTCWSSLSRTTWINKRRRGEEPYDSPSHTQSDSPAEKQPCGIVPDCC